MATDIKLKGFIKYKESRKNSRKSKESIYWMLLMMSSGNRWSCSSALPLCRPPMTQVHYKRFKSSFSFVYQTGPFLFEYQTGSFPVEQKKRIVFLTVGHSWLLSGKFQEVLIPSFASSFLMFKFWTDWLMWTRSSSHNRFYRQQVSNPAEWP